jgi:hypothetical protein
MYVVFVWKSSAAASGKVQTDSNELGPSNSARLKTQVSRPGARFFKRDYDKMNEWFVKKNNAVRKPTTVVPQTTYGE